MRTIAVGILTYNRVSVCVRNISVLLKNSEELSYNILVVDDGGKGEIEENIKNIKTNKKNLEIISHSKNKGLTESFCDLIENCKTDYLIWLPDDDHLIAESIPKIQSLLSENEPDFVSTVFKRDGKITRGKNENSTIKPKEFWESSFHGTGLIYKVNTLLNYTPLLRAKAKEYNYAAYMYPPEFLIIKLLSSGHKCIWSDIEIAYENNPSPSNLKFATFT